MYHVVGGVNVPARSDTRYVVSSRAFARHLAILEEQQLTAASVLSLIKGERRRCVAFTFDDGHVSHAWAAEALQRIGACADFFVNSSTINSAQRLSWSALRDIAAAGMSVQSHGHEHVYLDELSPAEVDRQLVTSKRMLEDRLGRSVELFAPPGGRMSKDLRLAASRAGYIAVCSSRAALWRPREHWEVPRLAVLQSTADRQIGKWIRQERAEILLRSLRYHALGAGKRILGNQRYEQLRLRALRVIARKA
jgi:peptidoglycan/xylan/chitin deacetylase (PgdA/CDA1 family)